MSGALGIEGIREAGPRERGNIICEAYSIGNCTEHSCYHATPHYTAPCEDSNSPACCNKYDSKDMHSRFEDVEKEAVVITDKQCELECTVEEMREYLAKKKETNYLDDTVSPKKKFEDVHRIRDKGVWNNDSWINSS